MIFIIELKIFLNFIKKIVFGERKTILVKLLQYLIKANANSQNIQI